MKEDQQIEKYVVNSQEWYDWWIFDDLVIFSEFEWLSEICRMRFIEIEIIENWKIKQKTT